MISTLALLSLVACNSGHELPISEAGLAELIGSQTGSTDVRVQKLDFVTENQSSDQKRESWDLAFAARSTRSGRNFTATCKLYHFTESQMITLDRCRVKIEGQEITYDHSDYYGVRNVVRTVSFRYKVSKPETEEEEETEEVEKDEEKFEELPAFVRLIRALSGNQ